MKNKRLFVVKSVLLALILAILPYLQSCAQTKIGRNLYLIGHADINLKNQKIMVENKNSPLAVRDILIKELKNKNCKILTRGEVFGIGQNLSQAEKVNALDSMNVPYVFLLAIGKKAIGSYHLSNTNANATANYNGYNGINAYGSSTTRSGNIQYLQSLQLGISIFSNKNNFKKPIAFFYGYAGANTKLSSIKSVSNKIIKRVIKYLKKEDVFKN